MDKARKFATIDQSNTPHSSTSGVLEQQIPEQARDAVLTTDLRGVITGCNLGLRRYGYEPGELVGRRLSDLFCVEDQSLLTNLVIPAVREKGRCEQELRGESKSGEEFCLRFCLTLLRDADSVPAGIVAISLGVQEKPVGSSQKERRNASAAVSLARRVIEGTEFLIASPVMHKFMGMVDRVAGHTETVLVVGETGTGKELVARTIHESSYRRSKHLVDINCAALPEHLVESELFGYEKGAFSGADASKPGLFELADKGTLFLDEIGELQLQTQVKLLRVLDGAPYLPVRRT